MSFDDWTAHSWDGHTTWTTRCVGGTITTAITKGEPMGYMDVNGMGNVSEHEGPVVDWATIPTEALRRELARREAEEEAARRAAFEAAHPCPECGARPVAAETVAVAEHRSAPAFPHSHLVPYDSALGTTIGLVYETTITCVHGHATTSQETKWFDDPRPGPPLLP